MYYEQVIDKEYRPRFESWIADRRALKDKNFFWPTGTQVYSGSQGSGKTLSAVRHTRRLKIRYPKSILVTNLKLTYLTPRTFKTREGLERVLSTINTETEYIYFQSFDTLTLALVGVNNDTFGVIYLIDEIHTYFNSLESKNIPMYVFTEISQQRKQRKLIIGTSQLFTRLAKPFREQCDNIIACNTIFGFITTQTAMKGDTVVDLADGTMSAEIRKRGRFFHTQEIRNIYDTYQKVQTGQEQYSNITLEKKPRHSKRIKT